MNQKEITEAFIMISNHKKTVGHDGLYKNILAL